jgi:hypothetical protein
MQRRRVRYGNGSAGDGWARSADDPVDPRTGEYRPGSIDPDERDDLEDMFIVMGKFVKDASRHLWKRVSKKQGRKGVKPEGGDDAESGGEKGGGGGMEKEGSVEQSSAEGGVDDGDDDHSNDNGESDGKEEEEEEVRQVVFIEGEEGVAIEFPKGLSQTETVGRGYAWRTVSVIATPKEGKSTPPPSRDASSSLPES